MVDRKKTPQYSYRANSSSHPGWTLQARRAANGKRCGCAVSRESFPGARTPAGVGKRRHARRHAPTPEADHWISSGIGRTVRIASRSAVTSKGLNKNAIAPCSKAIVLSIPGSCSPVIMITGTSGQMSYNIRCTSNPVRSGIRRSIIAKEME